MEDRIDINVGTVNHESDHTVNLREDEQGTNNNLGSWLPVIGSFLGSIFGVNRTAGNTQLTTEQRLALQAAEADRRRRQTYLIAGVIVALLLIMGAVAFTKK